MPPKVFKILDFITDGVKSSSKYWDDAIRTARNATHANPGLRVPLNSVQRKGYLDLQYAQSQYKYFQNPRFARFDFEQIAPLSEFQKYLPKGQVGDPFGAIKLLEGTTNPYLRSVYHELKSFYPIGKQLGLPSSEIKLQMDLRARDLFNNMYRVNTPMIFKLGGKIEKHQTGNVIGKGLKWIFQKGDDVLKTAKKVRELKRFNSGLQDVSTTLKFNSSTGSFDPVLTSPFNYKFKNIQNLTDDEIKILYHDLKQSGVITPEFEFAIGKQYNPYFTFDIKHINPENARRVYFDLPWEVSELRRRL